jgi:hypothetical protein
MHLPSSLLLTGTDPAAYFLLAVLVAKVYVGFL